MAFEASHSTSVSGYPPVVCETLLNSSVIFLRKRETYPRGIQTNDGKGLIKRVTARLVILGGEMCNHDAHPSGKECQIEMSVILDNTVECLFNCLENYFAWAFGMANDHVCE